MSGEDNAVQLALHIDAGSQADQEYLDRLTRQLLVEIRELDVETAELGIGMIIAPRTNVARSGAAVGESQSHNLANGSTFRNRGVRPLRPADTPAAVTSMANSAA